MACSGCSSPRRTEAPARARCSSLVAIEEVSKACATSGLILAVQELGALGLKLAGTPAQRAEWLPRLASGEVLAAYALTEAGSGSDSAAMLHAVRAVKATPTSSTAASGSSPTPGVAGLYTVFAKTDVDAGHAGISAFLVEADAPGFSVAQAGGEARESEARRPASSCSTACASQTRRLGEEGTGFRLAMRILDRSRPGVAAQALGIAQGATDVALDYARTRETMGRPIAQQQLIAAKLADMETRACAGRPRPALPLRQDGRRGRPPAHELTKASAMAKLMCGDVAMQVTTEAVQILGGYGYVTEYPVERLMRDAKITQIYEGTQEVQRIVIAREMLKEQRVSPLVRG